MASPAIAIPIVDLSPFFLDEEEGKKKVTEIIKQACSDSGLFQVVNHGIPITLINKAMELCNEFFDLPFEEKFKFHTEPNNPVLPLPHGYQKHKAGKNEYLFMCPPGTSNNVVPTNPPKLRVVIEELFTKYKETCKTLEGILNDCLGLPPNFLNDYNDDRSLDMLMTVRYFPATKSETNGAASHQDPNFFTLIYQDDVGGLEVLKDGEWIPVAPVEGALVFHISDILQVLSNNKFVSPYHQAVRHKEKNRYASVFFYNLNEKRWVEPWPQFTTEIGEPPKYRKFLYKDYHDVKVQEKVYPPARPQDKTRILTFASATN